MAEVRKSSKKVKYDITEMIDSKVENSKKEQKKNTKKNTKTNKVEKKVIQKKSLWVRFRIFWHGVGSEFKKVHWPTKQEMVKYSLATIFFVVFLSLFFYIIDVLFALVQSLA